MVQMIIQSWIDSIAPEWWIAIIAIAAAVAFYFLHPILIPIWLAMPKWLRWVLGGFVITIIAFAGGRYKGAQNEKALQKERDARADHQRTEEDVKVKDFSDDRINNDLRRGGGMRDE